jgi:hypothetical protein
MDHKTALIELRDKVKAGEATHGCFARAFINDDPGDVGCVNIAIQAHHSYSGSLDAAKALHEAVLPGFAWFVQSDYRGDSPESSIEGYCVSVCFESENPARAWLLAILEALISQESEK